MMFQSLALPNGAWCVNWTTVIMPLTGSMTDGCVDGIGVIVLCFSVSVAQRGSKVRSLIF